ncbi:hypothetical protein IE5_05581 [Bacillus cereus BAG3X2-2]|nr:hypothetical protein IE5_05581 [Bacillus cereus BAG3X2-2]
MPSTLSHEDRYLPNAWVVTVNSKQKIQMTIDREKVDPKRLDEIDTKIKTHV